MARGVADYFPREGRQDSWFILSRLKDLLGPFEPNDEPLIGSEQFHVPRYLIHVEPTILTVNRRHHPRGPPD